MIKLASALDLAATLVVPKGSAYAWSIADADDVLVRTAAGNGAIAASMATDVLTPQVAALKASGAVDISIGNDAFRAGVLTMSAAVGKRLDLAEGGTPEALANLADQGSKLWTLAEP